MNEFITLLQLTALIILLLIAFTILFVVLMRKIRWEMRKKKLLSYFGKFTEDEGTREFAETLAESKKQFQEPEILKYLGNHEVDDEIREFDKFLAESKKQFSTKQIDFKGHQLDYICWDCGTELLKQKINKNKKQKSISTWYFSVCDNCQAMTSVTESRDFGYPIKK